MSYRSNAANSQGSDIPQTPEGVRDILRQFMASTASAGSPEDDSAEPEVDARGDPARADRQIQGLRRRYFRARQRMGVPQVGHDVRRNRA